MAVPMTSANARHLAAIARSVDAGFAFLHLPDAQGVAAIHAERRHGGAVDTYTFRGPTEAIAARFRAEEHGEPGSQPLWQRAGSVAEVVNELMALPPQGAPGAPTVAVRASSALWTPGAPWC